MEFVTNSSTDANLSAVATQNQLNEVRILCYNVCYTCVHTCIQQLSHGTKTPIRQHRREADAIRI